ncbi:MAG: exo-alpha-sialidase [Lentisphaerae bacterium]|nr:exo-alpha-sialidase [Lentisphaerota bacterium]
MNGSVFSLPRGGLLAALLAAGCATHPSLTAGPPAADAVRGPDGEIRLAGAERLIAAHGKAMFPVLIKLDDGTLAAVIRGGAFHVGLAGRLDLITSQDGGRTWSEPSAVVDSEWDDRNPAFGQMPDGTLVCAYGEARSYNEQGKWDPEAGPWVPRVVTSGDRGATWSAPRDLDLGGIGRGFPYGKITVTPSGAALMSVYGGKADGAGSAVGLLRSTDNGKTWGDFSFITQETLLNETAVLALSDDHIVAAVRDEKMPDGTVGEKFAGTHLKFTESLDGGRTWSEPRAITERPGRAPGDLIRLRDGRLLLTYGQRTRPMGAGVMLSNNLGRTWRYDRRALLHWEATYRDCGYPSSVQLDDGTIVTLYYLADVTCKPILTRVMAARYHEEMLP